MKKQENPVIKGFKKNSLFSMLSPLVRECKWISPLEEGEDRHVPHRHVKLYPED